MYSAADLVAGALLAGLGTLILLATRRFPESTDSLGPAFLPNLVAAALILLAGLLALRAVGAVRRGESRLAESPEGGGLAKAAAAVAAIAAFVLALAHLPWIGFPVLAPILLVALAPLFGGRPGPAVLVVSITVGVLIYLVFRGIFQLPLPAPAWI
jgi:putative tricarboxylic transport membrane protein